jgi:alkanesulfonate monooxygenase SsuD/methylene tetrahydromethanopterin reductase-like flavin-dependent oxidoreductase (luciferase family)
MRIGVKPGQIGLTIAELRRSWAEAEAAGFESIWVFDHLTGPLIYESVTLLAALAVETRRPRIGCLVLANGTRQVETLAAQLATVDALSDGRLEVGMGTSSQYARLDFEALGIPYGSWEERVTAFECAVDRLIELTGSNSPLGARPVQAPLPLILGGESDAVRRMVIERGLAWNLSATSIDAFTRLKMGQTDPQAQVFLRTVSSVSETVAQYRDAGATRLVFVLEPPIQSGDITQLAREAGL